MNRLLQNLLPHGVVKLLLRLERQRQFAALRSQVAGNESRVASGQETSTKSSSNDFRVPGETHAAGVGTSQPATRYPSLVTMRDEAIAYLTSLGLDQTQLEFGSMPGEALEHVALAINAHLPADQPLYALHIGNFVGVSLACLTSALAARQPDSLVVAIDPNLPHRGIVNPQQYVIHLLDHFRLSNNVLLLTGFSHNATPQDDGKRPV